MMTTTDATAATNVSVVGVGVVIGVPVGVVVGPVYGGDAVKEIEVGSAVGIPTYKHSHATCYSSQGQVSHYSTTQHTTQAHT